MKMTTVFHLAGALVTTAFVLFVVAAANAATMLAVTMPFDWWAVINQVAPLVVTLLTPIVVAFVKKIVPQIPSWLLPILVLVIGLAVSLVTNLAGATDLAVWQGALLGALGLWLRELYDQIKKRLTPAAPEAP